MAIEIIPKPPIKIPQWLNFLFYFSIALVIAAILSYFIFNNALGKADLTLENLEEILAKAETPQEKALEKKILGYQKKIQNVSILLETHLAPSNFFGFLEDLCHPQVWFSAVTFWPKEAEVLLTGEAESFQALGQQIFILKEEKKIKGLKLSGVSLDEKGRIKFSLNLSLLPEIFKF